MGWGVLLQSLRTVVGGLCAELICTFMFHGKRDLYLQFHWLSFALITYPVPLGIQASLSKHAIPSQGSISLGYSTRSSILGWISSLFFLNLFSVFRGIMHTVGTWSGGTPIDRRMKFSISIGPWYIFYSPLVSCYLSVTIFSSLSEGSP